MISLNLANASPWMSNGTLGSGRNLSFCPFSHATQNLKTIMGKSQMKLAIWIPAIRGNFEGSRQRKLT
jgi:hypothetical protein